MESSEKMDRINTVFIPVAEHRELIRRSNANDELLALAQKIVARADRGAWTPFSGEARTLLAKLGIKP
jgi:hypothetical protein